MEFKKHYSLILFLCLFCVQIFAQSGSEKINVNFKNIPLKEALPMIEKAAPGWLFSYDATTVDLSQKVSLTANGKELRLAMRDLVASTNLEFTLDGNRIVLTVNDNKVIAKKGAAKKVSGIVKDENGEPVIGATVLIKGTVNGVVTDIDGKYSIQTHVGDLLEFSYIGYNSVEQRVKDKGVINVTLAESNVKLDDVVVVGYGTQKKESVSSSVNTVKPAEFAIPARNLSTMLAGQVAGVIAIQRSGEPGNDDASFWIRGQSSYAGGTSPLVLVDGVPRSMNDIDTDEIETFTVLKDAAATAVYGSEGANGVGVRK